MVWRSGFPLNQRSGVDFILEYAINRYGAPLSNLVRLKASTLL